MKEIKCFTSTRTTRSRAGCGTRKGGGNCLSNGHTHAFGNTLEKLTWENACVQVNS